jgi:molecular chaperone GrpE
MKIGNMLKNKSKPVVRRLRKRVEKLEQEKTDMYETVVSTLADFENYKKRAAREQLVFKKFANQELLQNLLTIVDSIEEIPTYSNDGIAIEGVKMIIKETDRIFKKFNVEPIDAVGQLFDPKFHQAISVEETGLYIDNTILSEHQKGYMIHDRLLRPSMVTVSTLKKEN